MPHRRDHDLTWLLQNDVSLPAVSRLISRPVASFIRGDSIWEIGWNGTWVECWKAPAPPRPTTPPPV